MVSWSITELDQVDSTQDLVRERALNDADEGLVVQAGQQLKGRGRHGKIWASLPDNLQMSILLHPQAKADITHQLSFVVACAIARAFSDVPDLGLKWPNDIFIGDQKAGGILIEAAAIEGDIIPYVIIGIGLNITSAPDGGAVLGGAVHDARDKVLAALSDICALWQNEGFIPVRELWLQKAIRIGQEISVRGATSSQKGVFHGIDENGALLLQTPEKTIKTISAGEVWF